LVESFVVEHVVLDVPHLAQIVVGVHLGVAADPYLLVEVETVEDVLGIVGEGDLLDDLGTVEVEHQVEAFQTVVLAFEGFLAFVLQVLEVVLA
jgi:hypothetical protein